MRREDYWKGEKEEFEKWERRKNVVWGEGLEGRNEEERKVKLRRIVERVLEREGKIIRVSDRRGEKGGRVLIVEFEEESEAGKIIENRGK